MFKIERKKSEVYVFLRKLRLFNVRVEWFIILNYEIGGSRRYKIKNLVVNKFIIEVIIDDLNS